VGVLGGPQLVDFFEAEVYLFLNGFDRVFAWSSKTVKRDVSSGKHNEWEVTDATGVWSILLC
jgi:hypothetical protein